MKLDVMTVGAVGFAAFAAWYALRKTPATGSTGLTDAQLAMYGMSTTGRQQSGASLGQNNDQLAALLASIQWTTTPYDASTATRRSDFQ